LSDGDEGQFIQTLHFDWSEKLDKALRDLLVKTDDDYLAKGCLDRLVGRGYDADIEAYLKRRLPKLKDGYEKDQLLPYQGKLGWSRLHASVDLDVREMVETVLKEKVPVDAQARNGRTALHIAAGDGKAEMCEVLLAANANPNIKDGNGQLPVQLAANKVYVSIVRQLIAKKSEVPDIFVASIAGATDKAVAMLKVEPALVKRRNSDGFTPLHVASHEGQTEIVRALLAAGADAKAIDDQQPDGKPRNYFQGWTALHLAALIGQTAVARLLLESGADINAAAKRGRHTPLHYAAWNGKEELVTLLLARDADRSAKDDQQRTPLDLAKEKKNLAAIKLLDK
jgi:ankyrin repeat protein